MAINKIYQFKVTLRGIQPPIWRRIKVNNDITFYEFHEILQEVMGWEDYHLHLFDLGDMIVTDTGTLAAGRGDGLDEDRARLQKYVTWEGQQILYKYDFGDSWKHDVVLEKMLPAEPKVHYPRCLEGQRACPPEDCGGIWGYANLLEALKDPKHPEHEMYLEWLGEELDPEAFDLAEINEILQDF